MVDKPILEKRFNENLNVEKRLEEGNLLARLFIEVQSNDKKVAEKALQRTIFDSLASEKRVSLLHVKFYEIKEIKAEEKAKERTYSGVVEVKALFYDFRWFLLTLMHYGPSAIEIISPEEYTLNLEEMQAIVSDVSGFSQSLSSQIMALLKDPERKKLYQKMLQENK